jgi:hypothetical protein
MSAKPKILYALSGFIPGLAALEHRQLPLGSTLIVPQDVAIAAFA